MSELVDARFRWVILQALYDLRAIPAVRLDSSLDTLYEFVLTQTFKQIREILGDKKPDLALVRLWARRIVRKLQRDIDTKVPMKSLSEPS